MPNNGLKSKKIIGVLGGMGPVASANLYHKIIKLAQDKYFAEQDSDFPQIIINSLPLVGFNETGFVDPDLVKKQLIKGVKTLEKAGCDLIVIACNTVHFFHADIQKSVKIPVLNIIDLSVERIKKDKRKVVGLLSSESTRKLGLYKNAIEKKKIKVITVTEDEQQFINKLILDVMSGKVEKKDGLQAKEIIMDLKKEGADSILLGCTELPLVVKQEGYVIPVYDSTQILAEEVLKIAYAPRRGR